MTHSPRRPPLQRIDANRPTNARARSAKLTERKEFNTPDKSRHQQQETLDEPTSTSPAPAPSSPPAIDATDTDTDTSTPDSIIGSPYSAPSTTGDHSRELPLFSSGSLSASPAAARRARSRYGKQRRRTKLSDILHAIQALETVAEEGQHEPLAANDQGHSGSGGSYERDDDDDSEACSDFSHEFPSLHSPLPASHPPTVKPLASCRHCQQLFLNQQHYQSECEALESRVSALNADGARLFSEYEQKSLRLREMSIEVNTLRERKLKDEDDYNSLYFAFRQLEDQFANVEHHQIQARLYQQRCHALIASHQSVQQTVDMLADTLEKLEAVEAANEQRNQELAAQLLQHNATISAQASTIAGLDAEIARLGAQLQSSQSLFVASQCRVSDLSEMLEHVELEKRANEEISAETLDEASQLQQRCQLLQQQCERSQQRINEAERQERSMQLAFARCVGTLHAVHADYVSESTARAEYQSSLESLMAEFQSISDARQVAETALVASRHMHHQLEAQCQSLTDTVRQRDSQLAGLESTCTLYMTLTQTAHTEAAAAREECEAQCARAEAEKSALKAEFKQKLSRVKEQIAEADRLSRTLVQTRRAT